MEFYYKIRYAETDQMGIVHHANYLLYLEQARIEWLEKKGVNYAKLEEEGIMLPVLDISIKYKKPLRFGERVKVMVNRGDISGVRIPFDYKLYNSLNDLVVEAKVVLVFMSAKTRRPMKCPPELYTILMA
jgi:acyl-CoA thioester hydrolase